MRRLLLALLLHVPALEAGPVVIGHPAMAPIDTTTVERVYTGKVVEVNGIRVTPVNLPPGDALRLLFLKEYLQQDDAKYIGYWTVRRYVGKGTPPRELPSVPAIIDFVTTTPGAIGYIDEQDASSALNVLATPAD